MSSLELAVFPHSFEARGQSPNGASHGSTSPQRVGARKRPEDHTHKGSTMDRQYPAPVGMDETRVEY